MKRYSHLLAGASWMAEYGDPDTADWDAFLKRYSAYHNIQPGASNYPPLLMTTSTRDDRVHPYHARAFVKRLQDTKEEGSSSSSSSSANGGRSLHYYENIEGATAGRGREAAGIYDDAVPGLPQEDHRQGPAK